MQNAISIHALREEGDQNAESTVQGLTNFYPRPPRGGRPVISFRRGVREKFLSTPSARRATRVVAGACLGLDISIHALREEGDAGVDQIAHVLQISIHALREEGDCRCRFCSALPSYFYPRPPRGGRLSSSLVLVVPFLFLSTPSARRATCHIGASLHVDRISIHALREEGDLACCRR